MTSAKEPRASGESHSSGRNGLTLWIVIGIVAAVALALVFPNFATSLDVGGQIFLRLLQMVVVPLVMASVMSGILGMGDVRKLGRPGSYTVLYYLSTTVLAVATGLVVVNIVNPGVNLDKKLVEDSRKEGARQVHKVVSATGQGEQKVTWYAGAAEVRVRSGQSDAMLLAAEREHEIRITLVQDGVPNEPGAVQIQYRPHNAERQRDGKFQNLGARLTAKPQAGVFEWTKRLPRNAAEARIVYQAPQGGESGAVTAVILPGPPGMGEILKKLVLMLFTSNLLASMVEINLLPLIVFSIVFAAMLTTLGKQSETIANLVIGVNDAFMSFIMLLMNAAPIGIFCLVAARFGKAQADGKFLQLLNAQLYYIVTVLVGLAIHGLVTLPALLYIFTRRNPYRFMLQMSQAVLTAFSTASSTATLPVTMECAETNAGVSKRSTEFVLPLGATINMDGTALYEAAAAIFIARAYATIDPAFQLSLAGQMTIAITATLAAIGAAGIPEAGLVTMLIVLNAVGLPLELIGLILPVDWLLDRFRTAVNTFGDSVGSAIVDKSFDAPPALAKS